MAQPPAERTSSSLDYLAAALGWLIPGAGHFFLGYRGRALVFGITVHVLFFAGLFIGGVRAVNPPDQPIWKITQPITGWPWILSKNLSNSVNPAYHPGVQPILPSSMPQIVDAGAVYCGIAGMLNILVLFDVITRIARSQAAPRTKEGTS